MDLKQNQAGLPRQNSQDYESTHQRIPEIDDIYTSIYGIVQSKLDFYENKLVKDNSKPNTPTKKRSYEYVTNGGGELNLNGTSGEPELEVINHIDEIDITNELPDSVESDRSLTPNPPPTEKKHMEVVSNPDLLNNCSLQCNKCSFGSDREEVLTEINARLKVEVDYLKDQLKTSIEKNNELNFEIANIETALETYYKEAKHQKSTISTIYSSMTNYGSKKDQDSERYTYKRIKAISDYVETLKVKLQHQDRIIKNNFLENPYSTDMMMKYDAVRQQLDKVSDDNQDLRNEIKKRQEEEIEIIKELNRQKFKIEEKGRETENYYKNELAARDIAIVNLHDKHDREVKEFKTALDKKTEDVSNIQSFYEAKISNYKDELVVIYRKLKTESAK